MKTLIVSSSLSANSRSFILCELVSSKLRDYGIDVELVDAREIELLPCHLGPTNDLKRLSEKFRDVDNVIFGMGVHCYSINDSLKMILDSLRDINEGMFFGILCAAGGQNSYLSTMHLTQICMNEWRMMQLPRVVYATSGDFEGDKIISESVIERIDKFCHEFVSVGERLI